MLEPIPFKDIQGINMEKLKEQMDRRISKISYLVDKKIRKGHKHHKRFSPQRLGNKQDLREMAIQTQRQENLLTARSLQLHSSTKAQEVSFQTNLQSGVGIGINTDIQSANCPNYGLGAVSASLDTADQGLFSPRNLKQKETQLKEVIRQAAQNKWNLSRTHSKKQSDFRSESPILEQREHSQGYSQADSLENFPLDDDVSRQKQPSSSEQQEELKQSVEPSITELLASKNGDSPLSRSEKDRRDAVSIDKMEKRDKENNTSQSKDNPRVKTEKSIPKGSVKKESFSGVRKVEKGKRIKSQVISQSSVNKLTEQNEPSDFSSSFLYQGNSVNRNSVKVPSVAISKNSKGVRSASKIGTQRKLMAQKTERFEKIVIESDTKQKMKQLVKNMAPRSRRDANDATVRANLLKRIQQKHNITRK